MKVKCEYCGSMISDTADKCPNCGATNENVMRTANKTPKTIAELEAWYRAHNLPSYETTRFFIGINYEKPKAFGIYQDGDEFVVYKNKDNGERAVRYRGTDEAYAVNELYMKLKSEILNQKSKSVNVRRAKSKKRFDSSSVIAVATVVFIFAIAMLITLSDIKNKTPHYYNYDETVYVTYDSSWYAYDDYDRDYYYVSDAYIPYELQHNMSDYEYDYSGYTWDDGSQFVEFKDSDYYDTEIKPYESSSDSDSDYSWDSGSDSWDSGSTDWGSDW